MDTKVLPQYFCVNSPDFYMHCLTLGLAGAVTSIAPSPSVLASTALDQFSRIHSTFAPPPEAGQQQERKGEVLDKIFMQSIPTVVVWDHELTPVSSTTDDAEDEVWDNMAHVDEDSDEGLGGRKKKKGKLIEGRDTKSQEMTG